VSECYCEYDMDDIIQIKNKLDDIEKCLHFLVQKHMPPQSTMPCEIDDGKHPDD